MASLLSLDLRPVLVLLVDEYMCVSVFGFVGGWDCVCVSVS